jgi:hypothetical protein
MELGTTSRDDKLSREEWESGWPWNPTQERFFQGKVSSFLMILRKRRKEENEKDSYSASGCFYDGYSGVCSESNKDYH